MSIRVAALYVEEGGTYFGIDDVDPWPESRDARLYAGPWPVVAHPPCERWCQLAPLNESRLGYAMGDDAGCFAAALNAVRTYGGVLEHPALSYAWREFELPRPGTHGWTTAIGDIGATTEVAQVAYGHEARKRTWLYAVGCELPELDWREPAATKQVSAMGLTKKRKWNSPRGVPWEWSETLPRGLSRFTPESFRDVLLDMARSASRVAA